MQGRENLLCSEVMDMSEIQRFQNELSKVANITIACFNANNKQVTSISGMKKEIEYFIEGERKETVIRLMDASYADGREEQVIEQVINRKIAVVNIYAHNMLFLRYAVMSMAGAGPEFERSIDLLRVGTNTIVKGYLESYEHLKNQADRSMDMEERDKEMQAARATAEIVKLIDSDDSIEKVLEQATIILKNYMKVSGVGIFQSVPEKENWEMVCGCDVEKSSLLQFPFHQLKTDKPIVHSSNNVGLSGFAGELQKLGIQAIMIYPLIDQSQGGKMVLALSQVERKRTFTVDEIKYMVDIVKVIQNILARRIQKNSLAGSYQVLQSILNNVGSAVYVRDAKTKEQLFVSRNLRDAFREEVSNGGLDQLIDEYTEKKNVVKEDNAEEEQGENVDLQGVYEVHCNANSKWYDLRKTDISWVDDRDAVLYAFYDITEKKIYQRKIEQQAFTDFLTGLYNRLCCERDLKKYIEKAERKGSIGALLYMDLDDFKHINDGLGHQYGDILLQSIAKAIRSIKGLENSCYRMGGDEFVMIVPPGNYDRLEGILSDLKKIFNCPWYLKDTDYYCTMSMGVVTFPEHGSDIHEIIMKADVAMYEAKKSGKNKIATYSEDLNSGSNRRLDMEKFMREAMENGCKEFKVYFQPLMHIKDGEPVCTGAEALIRWDSERMGFMNPGEFIPLAEYLGLINPIGDYVLEQACQYCKSWNDGGFPDFKVSVNLSVAQLLQNNIVENIEKIIKKTGINPKNLVLEVTESLAINDMDRMHAVLSNIKKLGAKIALDDFGTGYSSLNYIREMPLDIIKVDQSFVKDLSWDPYSQSFLHLVVELGKTIEVEICTEGVETRKQLMSVESLDIQYVQGFFFDKPLPPDKFEKKYVSPMKE